MSNIQSYRSKSEDVTFTTSRGDAKGNVVLETNEFGTTKYLKQDGKTIGYIVEVPTGPSTIEYIMGRDNNGRETKIGNVIPELKKAPVSPLYDRGRSLPGGGYESFKDLLQREANSSKANSSKAKSSVTKTLG